MLSFLQTWGTTGTVAVLKRTLIPLAVAIIVALAAMGSLETMQESPPSAVAELRYNAFAEGVDLRFHDAEGRIGYAVQAANQTRFNDNSIHWGRPFLQWFEDEGADWSVSAEQGLISPAGDTIRLTGDVALWQSGGSGELLTLTTAALDIDLESETLSTEEQVQMVAGGLRQSAAGLVLNLPQDSLTMLGEIRGSHVQP